MDINPAEITDKPEAMEGAEQKWMFESIKGSGNITVEKGANNGEHTYC